MRSRTATWASGPSPHPPAPARHRCPRQVPVQPHAGPLGGGPHEVGSTSSLQEEETGTLRGERLAETTGRSAAGLGSESQSVPGREWAEGDPLSLQPLIPPTLSLPMARASSWTWVAVSKGASFGGGWKQAGDGWNWGPGDQALSPPGSLRQQ